MIIKNARVFTEDGSFVHGDVVVKDGRFDSVLERTADTDAANDSTQQEIIDASGLTMIPGLVDIHFHGCKGDDFCDGDKDAIGRIAEYEASVGVTAIAPATMTLPVEELEQILHTAAEYKKETKDCRKADFLGINMEGPFISPAKKGAQDARNILPCNVEICDRFLKASEGLVKFIGIAPEESDNAAEFIREVHERVNVSLAHTNADYDTAMEACRAGANHAVHLYNAMPAFTHRAPGVVGAVFDNKDVMAEIICDGIHIHPSVVRATFQMMGADRMILISDSMRATGMPDGQYTLGGLDVKVVGRLATLVSDGAIAGSATNLMDCMRTVVKKMDLPLETAVACATINPARSLGVEEQYGSLEAGKKAHVVLLDQDLELKAVIKDGVKIR